MASHLFEGDNPLLLKLTQGHPGISESDSKEDTLKEVYVQSDRGLTVKASIELVAHTRLHQCIFSSQEPA